MKGDFTRSTFDHKKHYSSVRMQQGRVQLDADWNEQVDIQTDHLEQSLEDVVGPCGAPFQNAGYALSIDDDNLMIGEGHYYVHGTLCENETKCNYLEQENIKDAELPKLDGNYLFYLDVWQKHVTAVEDESISEIALGGPDTTTRTKIIWQVKYIPISGTLDDKPCLQSFDEWNKLIARRDAQLKASVANETSSIDPCIVPSGAGYRGLENHLYRVEIHRVDGVNTTFKWSRDNGSILRAVDMIGSNLIKIKNAGQDILHAFKRDQWIEITDERRELNGEPGTLVHLTEVKDGVELKFNPVVIGDPVNSTNYPEKYNPKVRRWDQTKSGEIMIDSEWIELEHGLGVEFKPGNTYKSGDFWLIPARIASGDIEWSKENGGWQQCFGIEHKYCSLAILNYEDPKWKLVKDCRQLFPPLTDITADDVSFDNSLCHLPNVETVQEALNNLCKRYVGGCTLTAVPGTGWEAVFNSIKDGQDARVCFGVGEYLLDETVILKNKGHLTISGCGAGTRIIAPEAEMVFMFEACKSVTVQDLYIESGVAGSGQDKQLIYLNGTLTFCACPKVSVDKVELKCAAGARRAASCINVRDAAVYDRSFVGGRVEPIASVRINSCDLHVGHQQVGILLVNVLRVLVGNNILKVSKKPGSLTLPVLLQNREYRSAVRTLMIHEPVLGEPENDDVFLASDTVGISGGKGYVWFKTDTSLTGVWGEWIKRNPPRGVQNDRDLLFHLMKIADNVLLNQGKLVSTDGSVFSDFGNWYGQLRDSNPAAGSQGIVVAGSIARDIHILNNKIWGVLQGIHIGVSHRAETSGAPDMAGTVHIRGNNIGILLSPVVRDRHGIFVGNCDSLIVQDNYARVKRSPVTSKVSIDGIRIQGHLGRMMIVRQNHLVGSTVGIRVIPLSGDEGKPQWIVTDNVAPNSENAVLAPPKVRGRDDNYA
ncbi:MAG TPA: DUF6519 domain-containing protein [Candidatus Nanoarchaeia archaeon]|nr:DUF6519 domain-containing protein [Candidatus Nanoarchaeia archaeon]